MTTSSDFTSSLAEEITRSASKQAYYTVRFLVDRDRVPAAFQAYAYFRWLDDRLDLDLAHDSERVAFVDRQTGLMNDCYAERCPRDVSIEEHMLVDLIRRQRDDHAGLENYIRNMMVVMSFDAHRRGRLVSKWELDRYTLSLATAVTEALHYFVGRGSKSPHSNARYLAATGAHITHMLRDSREDAAAGYYNIPLEYLESHAITPEDISTPAYRAWVRERAYLARSCFRAGKAYLSQVQNLRCRIAGYAYMARFEGVLDAIQRQGFLLQSQYGEHSSVMAGIKSSFSVFGQALRSRSATAASRSILVD